MLFFVSVYAVERMYGGPEEGGWWYDWYDFVEVYTVRKDESAYNVAHRLNDDNKPVIDRFSVLGGVDTCYMVENSPGEETTREGMRYE